MEKFQIIGNSYKETSKKYYLTLPEAKHFEHHFVAEGEDELQFDKLISKAIIRGEYICSNHLTPWVGIQKKDKRESPHYPHIYTENTDVPRTLQKLLQNNPYPLSQGPVILPLDCATEDKKSESEIVNAKTMFKHKESQKCFEWRPKLGGISAWGGEGNKIGYDIKDANFSIEGAASSLEKEILYTCNFQKCIIQCPCSICTEKCRNCTEKHKCQCSEHELIPPHLFQNKTHHFTMITDKIDKYRYAVPHAGIPLSCPSCTKDVLEHQTLHLIFHIKCRFCRYLLRPLEECSSVITFKDFKKAAISVRKSDLKTCSYCFFICKDKYERINHEATIHENKPKKYKCDNCSKTYSNRNALSYHQRTKHEPVSETYPCDTCDSHFTFQEALVKHKQRKHKEGPLTVENKCEDCGQHFNQRSHLFRHMKEQHANYSSSLCCEQCGIKFTRYETLRRHIRTFHTKELKTKVQCCKCNITFSRKENLLRHMKLKDK